MRCAKGDVSVDVDAKKIAVEVGDFIRDILTFKAIPLVGVDIGQSAIKMAVVQKSGDTYKLVRYSSVPLPEAAIIEDEIQQQEEIIEAIREAYKKLKTNNRYTAIGLFGPNTIARKLQLAGGTPEEIDDQVTWEAEQYLPFAIEDSAISHYNFGENEGGGVDVLVCAARNDVLMNFKDLIDGADLKAKVVDIGLVSMANVMVHVLGDLITEPTESFMFLDIGAQKTSMVIMKDNKIMFAKEMPIGGGMITEEIQRQMGVNYYEAEDLKTTGDENGNLPEEILEIIDDVVESFFGEIKKTVDFYVSSTQDESLVGCYITGGSSNIPGIIEGLEALLGVEVAMLNVFETITYDKKTVPTKMLAEINSRGVQAIGLAMREFK